MHRRAPLPNASHPGCRLGPGSGTDRSVRGEGRFRGFSCRSARLTNTLRLCGIRHGPRSKCDALTRLPGRSIMGRTRSTSKIVARRKSPPPSSTSLTSSANTSGWRRNRSKAQLSADAVVSWPAPMRVTSSSQISSRDIPVPSACLLRNNNAKMSVRSPIPGSASARSIIVNTIRSNALRISSSLLHGLCARSGISAPAQTSPGSIRVSCSVGRSTVVPGVPSLSAEDGPQDHVHGDPVHRFERSEILYSPANSRFHEVSRRR